MEVRIHLLKRLKEKDPEQVDALLSDMGTISQRLTRFLYIEPVNVQEGETVQLLNRSNLGSPILGAYAQISMDSEANVEQARQVSRLVAKWLHGHIPSYKIVTFALPYFKSTLTVYLPKS
jgi:hypothetical protein